MRKRKRSGFTLIETLVSITIISFILLAAAGIYTFSIGLQKKSQELASLEQEANYVLNLMSKDIRASMVDYSYPDYDPEIPFPTSVLALKNYFTNQEIVYFLDNKKIMKKIDENDAQPLTSNEIETENLQFYILPTTDPFINSSGTTHPRITIVLELKSDSRKFNFQQTIIQRYGERK